MDIWSQQYQSLANFICISATGRNLSETFVNDLKLKHCITGWTNETPKWGQLGCNGFIIYDKDMNIACRKSKAYLEVRDEAFRDVENKLNDLLKFKNNDLVQNHSTSKFIAEDEKIEPLNPIKSVFVNELDDQHQQCANELQKLLKYRNKSSLDNVFKIFKKHFKFEETLLDTFLYPNAVKKPNEGDCNFNVDVNIRTSHYSDHARQLQMIRNQLKNLDGKDSKISLSFINQLFRDFENHANNYDNYGERLNNTLNDI